MGQFTGQDRLALIIEDDFDAATIFSHALKSIGFEPEIIASGEVARRRLGECAPAIILLDMHLPFVAGTELIQQIRNTLGTQQSKVIVVSADPRMAESIEDKADLVLIKPVTFTQIVSLVKRFAEQ
jgi:DNA-binding response OmpR family regulator